jgi:hypothetical protein
MKKLAMAVISLSLTLVLADTAFAAESRVGLTCSDATGCKLCSGFIEGNFRDTIPVAQTWTPETCHAFADVIGTDFWQLGCMNRDSFVFGAPQTITDSTPNLPLDNTCNW